MLATRSLTMVSISYRLANIPVLEPASFQVHGIQQLHPRTVQRHQIISLVHSSLHLKYQSCQAYSVLHFHQLALQMHHIISHLKSIATCTSTRTHPRGITIISHLKSTAICTSTRTHPRGITSSVISSPQQPAPQPGHILEASHHQSSQVHSNLHLNQYTSQRHHIISHLRSTAICTSTRTYHRGI